MRAFLLVLAGTVGLAGLVFAADDVLSLRNGRLVVGRIKSVDEKGVTILTGEEEAKFSWETLTPRCQYEIRSERLTEKDAEGHAALADFCLAHRLYAEARTEANVARGLGFKDGEALDGFLADVNRAEAEETFARIEQLVAEEEFDKAREEIRRFLIQAPPSRYTEKARGMVADLIRRRDAQIRHEEEERKAAKDLEKQKKLAEKIADLTRQAREERDAANAAYVEGVRYHDIGNVTRARKGYEAAEAHLFKAYHQLKRVQRLVRRGPAFEKAEEMKARIRAKLVDVYLGLARLYIKDRNFKRGVPYLNKVLYLDPVNKEALDLRAKVEEQWIRRSARRLTNTPSVRVTGGGRR